MPTFHLRTPSGTETDPTPGRIAEALRAADRAADSEAFAVVERDDGAFVQLSAGGALEVGGSGPMPHRLDHAEVALAIVERLRRREDAWGGLPHWDMAEHGANSARERRRRRIDVAVAVLFCALLVAAAWYFSRD